MRTRTLALLLAGSALFAAWPIFVWAFARFGWIDERFVATLGSLSFSLPVALAAAALALVAHGLMVNSELYDLLELDEDELDEDEQVALGRAAAVAAASAPATVGVGAAAAGPNVVTVSGGTAMASAAPAAAAAEPAEAEPSKYGNKMAVAERKNQGFKNNDGKPKKPKRAKRAAKGMANRGKYTAKNAAGRALRDNIRFPRF
ncbi:MAG TPA: hypothetical protein VK906_17160 [Egicoccus sp.]|nr:hypothetical protein [Egicoccus sp.]HSK24917.1 hypothetical protein [Egicoccus sp.]